MSSLQSLIEQGFYIREPGSRFSEILPSRDRTFPPKALATQEIDPPLRSAWTRPSSLRAASRHPERRQIKVEDRLLLHPLVAVLSAQGHDLAHDLDVEAVGLGLPVDVLDVVGERLFLFLEPLDAFDESAQVSRVHLFASRQFLFARRFRHGFTLCLETKSGRGMALKPGPRQAWAF